MSTISSSVGNKGQNLLSDVMTVQGLMNKNLKYLKPFLPLKPDGICGPITIGMILEFQRRRVGLAKPDGCVDPKGKTLHALNEVNNTEVAQPKASSIIDNLLLTVQQFLKRVVTPAQADKDEKKTLTLTESDYQNAATLLSVDVATIKAVSAVESSGSGFLSNGQPKILFEGHWFSKLTKGKYDKTHPTISYPSWTTRYYLGGVAEYSRYNTAKGLDSEAAMKSASWGKFQIMGFNFAKAGYSSVESFVLDMYKSESLQLNAFVKYLKETKLDAPLRAKNWAAFAKGYNGPRYAENKYDIRLRQAYNAYSAKQ